MRKPALQTVGGGRSLIRSTTEINLPPSICTRRSDGFFHGWNLLVAVIETSPITRETDGGDAAEARRWAAAVRRDTASRGPTTIAAPKSQFRTDPLDHGKAPSNIAPLSPRSTTIGKSRVAIDPIAMHTAWRSNSDITSVTRVSMAFRVVRTNQYNQDLGLIHSTNGNHLESPNEGSSIDHQVTIHLHAQNITMFPTNETWYFTSQMLVSSSGGLILILTAQ
ncbi:hypothetical protein F511_24443 [Dorcoceras hygrometricum]|uniref:Uncharacterized protein n=1 Tax=Dorcoceras hygrometricum TaxID=472368 RepID=A0A2Z7CQW0_9LAMI|nr:hypothetical protein F511_24443 [Dorcoceras hygrometricum]